MGIYDREYYRSDSGDRANWDGSHRGGRALIIITVVSFLAQILTLERPEGMQLVMQGWFTELFWMNPERVVDSFQIWRMVSYAFLHDITSIMHIVMNMLILWWCGFRLEDRFGTREFVALYLVAAFVGAVGQLVSAALGFSAWETPVIGASGATYALLVIYAYLNPSQIVYVFFVLPMPIWVLVTLFLALDISGALGMRSGNTAYWVHIAGAVFGFAYIHYRLMLTNWLPNRNRRRVAREAPAPRLKIYQDPQPNLPSEPKSPPAAHPEVEDNLTELMDQVLEKVAREGQASLTPEERDILFRASERLKKRRK
ncbi:rhomboid family intramembrane serine protease [Tuwongella immobilis]|uniref:Peptidase S54 rhomboid domain-containing protein n=1 Tax=Tuwongella immobilis TaxID=692036 RepID=A0A6C2YQU8_9BACT|nr:rhomboid family intramembrane serine protease [Tuwongella immobilis]VIP03473.1 rhomboid family protein : Uncharacterized protein OS=Blastopirellula marina DSM 3645 GN=DSM3645_11162 PE=4 SV=1: Rhomboid [Tuwongella immobilis]VTS04318.1 rhomboid family protein : Uncharacterized protein OS=Blastopirellula marina DSM 3645 GN=DSM3645_11162 PE=4 SV=1: Rhomboid [Tuwongella immobilis]